MPLIIDSDGQHHLDINAQCALRRIARRQDAQAATMQRVQAAERAEFGYAAEDVQAIDRAMAHRGECIEASGRSLPGVASTAMSGGHAAAELPASDDAPSILIHESKASTTPLSLVLQRISRYGPAHERAERMSKHLRGIEGTEARKWKTRGLASKLAECGTWLTFRDYGDLIGPPKLHAATFCQQFRLCPFCAIRRTAKHLRAYSPKVLQVVTDEGLTPYLLTVTVKNGPDLGERVTHLLNAWREGMTRRRKAMSNSGRHGWTEFARYEGGIYSVEVKRGRQSQQWHPHLHAVILCATRPDQQALSREWQSLTGDSHIVDVRPFNCGDLLAGDEGEHAVEALAGDLAEVLKYPLKFADMTVADNWTAHQWCHGKRLMATFGNLRGVTVDPSLLDEPIDTADLPYVQYVARYLGDAEYELRQGDELIDPASVPALGGDV